MSDHHDSLSGALDTQSHQPRSVPLQPGNESLSTVDTSSPILGKAESTGRPRPPHLTWSQRREVGKDHSSEDLATGMGFPSSGPVSPVSPIGSSEVLRTPNVSDRSRYSSYRHSSSPGAISPLHNRLHSPASQIFERDVQEDILPSQASPSIPSHIRTENYIPPVLEASSAAITDEQLDPDSVEIVTHSLHHPAAVMAPAPSTAEQSLASSGIVDRVEIHSTDADEVSSVYGVLDTNDVRRLSFISFADVVNAEHAEMGESGGRELSQSTAVTGSSFAAGLQNRSPSPLRSPASSHGLGTSPPTSIAASFIGLEMSPSQGPRAPGSPFAMAQSPVSSGSGGELNVETMLQALRRTASGDLGGVTNQTTSTFGNDEPLDQSF
ncbi:hypothetical protein N7486_000903 [Penicillium sp. IBT 16267x]|nr:hypothetical protein N7486_000903 [Penicillium sp. IBT 16267x]